jgi:hypothetical protein
MGSPARSDQLPVLGIDGLPLGTHAAVAAGGRILSTFAVIDRSGRPRPLELRVTEALDRAVEVAGSSPGEVRLVCYDDGADGTELEHLASLLATRGVGLQVVGGGIAGAGAVAGSVEGADVDPGERSVGRARLAALW